ncbi:hypothetical protein M989_04749 [Kluyvera georgiana ATCC 51603]|uniref:Uncharacterized protein n=1 Tax=Kluyvera georgiana ATCC 51603 TaxID=1354264 RepID=A0A1B7J6G5_9ENTR|nr:hypothetical protein M989_04749 [Kluyvera georgiana ATCC 51603]
MSLVFEPALYLARAPAFIPVMGHAQQVNDVVWRAVRRMMRRAGPIVKTGPAFQSPAVKPLVAGGGRYAVKTAKSTDVRPVLRGEQNKLRT